MAKEAIRGNRRIVFLASSPKNKPTTTHTETRSRAKRNLHAQATYNKKIHLSDMKRVICTIFVVLSVSLATSFAQGWKIVEGLTTSSSNENLEPYIDIKRIQSLNGSNFVIGTFRDKLNYKGKTVSSNGDGLFILKIDQDGDVIDLRACSLGNNISVGNIILDKEENLYNLLTLEPKAKLPYDGYINNSTTPEVFIGTFNSNLEFKGWKKIIHGCESLTINVLELGDDGNLYIAGKGGKHFGSDKQLDFTATETLQEPQKAFGKYANPDKLSVIIPQQHQRNIDTLRKYYSLHKHEQIGSDIAKSILRCVYRDYKYNNDTLNNYLSFNIDKNIIEEWLNFNNKMNDNFKKHIETHKDKYSSTVYVGEKEYFTPIQRIHIVICYDVKNKEIKWSKGFSTLPRRGWCKGEKNARYWIPRKHASATVAIRNMKYYKGALYIVGAHDGWMIDGKEYEPFNGYNNDGGIDYFATNTAISDLLMMRMNADNGKVDWVRSGGGRGADEYTRLVEQDGFLLAIGNVNPDNKGNFTQGDYVVRSGNYARDGIMLDSMSTYFESTQKKHATPFAQNDVGGTLFAKYNIEGRLIEKRFDKGIKTPDGFDIKDSVLVSTARYDNTSDIVENYTFNNISIPIPPHSGGVVINMYNINGNPISALFIQDNEPRQTQNVKVFLTDNNNILVAGRSYSEEVVFKMLNGNTKSIEHKNYHPLSYYDDNYMERTGYKERTNSDIFNEYHAANTGYLGIADIGFQATFSHAKHITCYGDDNGELKVATYFTNGDKCTYEWSKEGEPNYEFKHFQKGVIKQENIDSSSVYELPAGKYIVIVRNGNAERKLEYEIKQPDKLEVNGDVTLSKWCENTGEILLKITGGTGSINCFWKTSNGGFIQADQANSTKLTQLGEGVYEVNVTDRNGCYAAKTFVLCSETENIKDTDINNSKLLWNYAERKLTFTTPTEVHNRIQSCKWKTENQSGEFEKKTNHFEANGLEQGHYTIDITINDGCTLTLTEQLANTNEFFVETKTTHIKCHGEENGEIEFIYHNHNNESVSIEKWELNGKTLTPTPNASLLGTYQNLKAGEHKVTFKHNDKTYTILTKIDEPEKLEVTMLKKNITCSENTDGQIAVEVKGGIEPYKYIWEDKGGEPGEEQARNNLNATTTINHHKYQAEQIYRVKVSDANGCNTNGEATIYKPKQITAKITPENPSCYGYDDGSLEIDNITGGNGYAYHIWENTLMAPKIDGLKHGKHTVTIYDSLGCMRKLSGIDLELRKPIETYITDNEIIQPTCAEIADGSIKIRPYKENQLDQKAFKYKWNGPIPANIIDTLNELNNVPSGIYEVIVIDMADKCETKKTYDLQAENKAPQVNLMLSKWEICDGESLKLYVEKEGRGVYDYLVNDVLKIQSTPKYSESTNMYVDTFDVSLYGAGEYTLSVIDYSEANSEGKQCQGKASAPLAVKYTPSTQIKADKALTWCPDVDIDLYLSTTDQPKTNFVWMKGIDTLSLTENLIIDNALGVGKYILHAESNGCHSKDSVEVARLDEEKMQLNVEPSDPDKGFLPSDTLWCYGEGHIATLEASRYDALEYLWFRNGDTLILGNGALLNSPVLMTNIPGEYYIIGKFGGCEVYSDTMKIGPRRRIELNIVKDTTIVAGKPYIIDLGENAAIQSYNWTEKDGQNILSSTHYMEIDTRYAQDGEVREYKVSVVDTNACPATAHTKIRIQRVAMQTTGLTDASVEPLYLYPNPTHNGFYAEAPAADRLLRIYGASGQIVLEQPIESKTWVSTANLSAGLYLVRTETSATKLVVE